MSKVILLMLMFVAGALVALQPSVNARLAQKIGLVESSCISFLVGTTFLLLLACIFRPGLIPGPYPGFLVGTHRRFDGGLFMSLRSSSSCPAWAPVRSWR